MSVLASTKIRNWGILPHGVDDPSVILKSDLTSAATITSPDTGSAGTVLGTPTFDSVKGMTNTNGANAAGFYELTNHADLEKGGQISFEIEKKLIASAALGGEDVAANTYIFTAASTSGTSGTLSSRWWKPSATDQFVWQHHGADLQNLMQMALEGEDDFVRMTISWNGSLYTKYINGRPVQIGAAWTNAYLSNHFKYIYAGSYTGKTDTGLKGYYIRNIQISSRPVMMPLHPSLANIAIIGHSFVNYAAETFPPAVVQWDMSCGRSIKAYLGDRGIGCNITYYGESGAVIDTNLPATTMDAKFILAVASRPTAAIIIAGTNDVHNGAWNATTFESEYKGYIEDLAATCEFIVVCTVTTQKAKSTYDSATYVANVAAANTVINALADYTPAANAACEIFVSDDFTAFGGESLGSNYFEGERTGALDDLHPSSKGGLLEGQTIGEQIIKALL